MRNFDNSMKFTSHIVLACALIFTAGYVHGDASSGNAARTQGVDSAEVSRTLAANEWTLTKIIGASGSENMDWPKRDFGGRTFPLLTFDREGHMFSRVCNFSTWRYVMDGKGEIKLKAEFMTMALCSTGDGDSSFMRYEAFVMGQLECVSALRVDAAIDGSPLLELSISDGSRWVLSGKPFSLSK